MNDVITVLDPRIHPHYATRLSAGLELQAATHEDLRLFPGQCELVPTGIRLNLELLRSGVLLPVGIILPKSGKGHRGLVLGNGSGLIDTDYKGEVKVSLWNRTEELIVVRPLEHIAQLFVTMSQHLPGVPVADQERGEGGFGSTEK